MLLFVSMWQRQRDSKRAATLWESSCVECRRIRLQSLLFPAGLEGFLPRALIGCCQSVWKILDMMDKRCNLA